VLVAPAKLMFTAILAFGSLALMFVVAGRALARAGLSRLISPERVLLIGTGQASGALIEKMRAKASLRLEPIGMVSQERSLPTRWLNALAPQPCSALVSVSRCVVVGLDGGCGEWLVVDGDLVGVAV
jgi:FlaA1/EpsC-like NDP-sugar epimerase